MTSAIINIEDDLWQRMHIYKYKHGYRNVNAVITKALKDMIEKGEPVKDGK